MALGTALALGLAGLAAGGAKHFAEDVPNEQKATKLAAETERYSPWTGLHGKMPERSSAIGSLVQGGTTGLMLGQGLSKGAAPTVDGASTGTGGPSLGVNTNLGYGGANQMAQALAIPNLGFNGDLGNGIPIMGSDYWSQLANNKNKYSTI